MPIALSEPFEIIFDPKPAERAREALTTLRAQYDLTPYQYTRRVVILPGATLAARMDAASEPS